MTSFSNFSQIFIFFFGALSFVVITLLIGKFFRPQRPNVEKSKVYESGEDANMTSMGNFNVRYYIIAMVFIIFEAELVFLIPWALVLGDEALNEQTQGLWGKLALVETLIFIFILALGWLYVWRHKMLDWIKPTIKSTPYISKIPEHAYKKYTQ